MVYLFLLILAASTAFAAAQALVAVLKSPTSTAPQEVWRFLTFGSIQDLKIRALSWVFHVALTASLTGHLFIFVPPPAQLAAVGTAVGLVAGTAATLLARYRLRGSVERALALALSTVLVWSGVAMGASGRRDVYISWAFSPPPLSGPYEALFYLHFASACLLAALVPFTLMSHVAVPVGYVASRLRWRRIDRWRRRRRMQAPGSQPR
ncbi:MAG: hypothetical protein QXP31_01825 [Pyrobaculum sp.]